MARPWLRTALLWGFTGLTVAYAPLSIPFGLPFVPPEPMARYAASLGIGAELLDEGARLRLVAPLPVEGEEPAAAPDPAAG